MEDKDGEDCPGNDDDNEIQKFSLLELLLWTIIIAEAGLCQQTG